MRNASIIRICHIIVGLSVGGAETMLKRLIESKTESISETVVISMTTLGVIGESLRARGVCVHILGISSIIHFPVALWRIVRIIRQFQPAVVQTWMYHADFLGGLAARLAGSFPVVWSVHSTAIPQGPLSVTYWLVRLCAICSYIIPHRIICCANSAKTAHEKLGYAADKMSVITNGYDFSNFEPNLQSSKRARLELGYGDSDIVIGVVGRFDVLKDFHNFVWAASIMSKQRSDLKFLMVGRDNEWSNVTLRSWIQKVDLEKNFNLVGQQSDVSYFLSAMDIFCLSSLKEAFPNVVVEAMAMGLPCIVTRSGDAAEILGNDNFVVPVKDSVSLAQALLRMCELSHNDRRFLGQRNSKKVREAYGIEKISADYHDFYENVLKNE